MYSIKNLKIILTNKKARGSRKKKKSLIKRKRTILTNIWKDMRQGSRRQKDFVWCVIFLAADVATETGRHWSRRQWIGQWGQWACRNLLPQKSDHTEACKGTLFLMGQSRTYVYFEGSGQHGESWSHDLWRSWWHRSLPAKGTISVVFRTSKSQFNWKKLLSLESVLDLHAYRWSCSFYYE